MGVFTSFTLRSLKKNKTRTIVGIIGIMLSVGLLTAVYTTATSVNKTYLDFVYQQDGSWHLVNTATSDEALEKIKSDDRVICSYMQKDFGAAYFEGHGRKSAFTVKSMPELLKEGEKPQQGNLYIEPEVIEGSIPKSEDEILLPAELKGQTLDQKDVKSKGEIQLGTKIDANLGARILDEKLEWLDAKPGNVLHSYYGVNIEINKATGKPYKAEHIEAKKPASYKVVGFYKENHATNYAQATGSSEMFVGLTKDSKLSPIAIQTWSRVAIPENETAAVKLADDIFGSHEKEPYTIQGERPRLVKSSAIVNNNLLVGEGMSSERALYDSILAMATVIAVVIGVAAISVIYNSFAISVAERTRQFGLLSSLGASKSQLMRTVLIEALIMGGIAIPLGVLLGFAGVFLTFAFISESTTMLIGMPLKMHIDWLVIGLLVVASFILVLISAAVPSIRAGRVSAIDAIRSTTDVKLSRKAQRKLNNQAKKSGLMDRFRYPVGGFSHFMARRNHTRNASKDRTITLSIGASVMLFVVTGALALYMQPLALVGGANTFEGRDADIEVTFFDDSDNSQNNATSEADLIAYAKTLGDCEYLSTMRQGELYFSVPKDSLTNEFKEAVDKENDERILTANNNMYPRSIVVCVNDDIWNNICQKNHLEGKTDVPQAIVINSYSPNYSDSAYSLPVPVFNKIDSLDVIEVSDDSGVIKYTWDIGLEVDNTGNVVVYSDDEDSQDSKIDKNAVIKSKKLDVVGSLDSVDGLWVGSMVYANEFPKVILNESAQKAYSDALKINSTRLSFAAHDSEKATEALETKLNFMGVNFYVADLKSIARDAEASIGILNVFVGLFTAIMVLVSVSNVFNTLTNSIILRRREFAILKSVGMGKKDFKNMLIWMCARYAVGGLLLGGIASAGAIYLLFLAMKSSFENIGLMIPWNFIIIAVIGVVLMLALSVKFALYKVKSDNIVESLRIDAI